MIVAYASPVFCMYINSMCTVQRAATREKGDLVGQGDWHIQFAKLDAAPLLNPAGVMSNDAA